MNNNYDFSITVDGKAVDVRQRDDIHNVSIYHAQGTVLWDHLSYKHCHVQCLDSDLRCDALSAVKSNLGKQLTRSRPKPHPEKLYFSNDEVAALCDVIVHSVSSKPTHIASVSRGGLVPGVMLSHHWDIPLIPVNWSTKEFVCQQPNELLPLMKLISDNTSVNILLVDDICDTGYTLSEITQHVQGDLFADNAGTISTACVCVRSNTQDLVDISATVVPDDAQVVFPWEEW